MIKKIVVNFFVVSALVALIYSRYIRVIEIRDVMPDFFLILTVFAGIFNNATFAMIFGFIAGLAFDICSYPLVGFHSLIYLVIGYTTFIPKLFYINNPLPSSILIFIYLLVKAILYFFIGLLFLEMDYVINYFRDRFLIETAYTVIISIPIFLIYKQFYSDNRKTKRNVQF